MPESAGRPVFDEEFKKALKERLEALYAFFAHNWPLGIIFFIIVAIVVILQQIILSVLNNSL